MVPWKGGLSETVRRSLSGPETHDVWEDTYRTPENERFYGLAFDRILGLASPPSGARFLDAGCGPGFHAMRLARRGYEVTAVDFSTAVLDYARANAERSGLADRITIQEEDLLSLSFADREFDYVLCWGVLTHIPSVDAAIAELCRVTAPGGILIVEEANTRSLEGNALRLLGKLRRGDRYSKVTDAGVEYWKQTEAGPLMTRVADIGWLEREFSRNGAALRHRVPTKFTELYTKLPWRAAKRLVHRFNEFWLRRVRRPGPAEGNVLILEKQR